MYNRYKQDVGRSSFFSHCDTFWDRFCLFELKNGFCGKALFSELVRLPSLLPTALVKVKQELLSTYFLDWFPCPCVFARYRNCLTAAVDFVLARRASLSPDTSTVNLVPDSQILSATPQRSPPKNYSPIF